MSERVFPQPTLAQDPLTMRWDNTTRGGLTKRELFAAMCVQGFLSSDRSIGIGDTIDPVLAARAAIDLADALIAELAKPKGESK